MRPECSHILPGGQKCRALAMRDRSRCHHHIDPAHRPPPRPTCNPDSRVNRWFQLSRRAHTLPTRQIPDIVSHILASLIADGADGISERAAGRLLRILLRRYGSVPTLPPARTLVDAPPPHSASWPQSRPRSSENTIEPELLDFLESQVNEPELMRRVRAKYS